MNIIRKWDQNKNFIYISKDKKGKNEQENKKDFE